MKAKRITWLQLFIITGLITMLIPAAFKVGPVSSISTFSIQLQGFVVRSGSQLMLNGSPFRFAGANMHWLALDDDTNYTSPFRVNDGFEAAEEMGITVVRSHNLGISTGCSNCIEPTRGVFNETALAHDDYVIKAARDHGIRLIIPLTDNWHYPTGGKHDFTDWRGISDENQFYFNTDVIKDFETYISTLLNHVNIYTGIAYKNDPTILGWETGNELQPPTNWTQTISTYIKSIDGSHLMMDGKSGGIDPKEASLTNVDIVSNHYYPKNVSQLERDAHTAYEDGKAFVVGEFDWNDANGGDTLSSFLSTIESNSTIAGDAFWELWPHDEQYGYVDNGKQYTLHYPGDSVAMRASVRQLRTHAYKMSQESVLADSIPEVPIINVIIRGNPNNVLMWRGTAVAASYTVERSTSGPEGPWKVICDECTDTSTPWTDMTTPKGASWYRVTAYNLSRVAGSPSNVYQATSGSTAIDTLDDWSKTYEHSSNLTFDTTNSQYTNGDSSRVIRTSATNEYIIWKQPGMTSFQAIAYFWPEEPVKHFSIYTSSDGKIWTLSSPQINSIGSNWLEYVYTLNGLAAVSYVKLVWNNLNGQIWNPDLGEVTIAY